MRSAMKINHSKVTKTKQKQSAVLITQMFTLHIKQMAHGSMLLLWLFAGLLYEKYMQPHILLA